LGFCSDLHGLLIHFGALMSGMKASRHVAIGGGHG